MHPSAMKNGKAFFDTYTAGILSARIIDLGSQNINGSLRQVCPAQLEYVGIDSVPGAGVDILLQDPYALPFEDESIDFIACSSVFEHVEFFWLLYLEMMRVLKPQGLLYMNAPSNGPFHRYPVDCWRFYPDSGHALINWGKRNGLNCVLLESFISRQDQDYWNDFVTVMLKDREHLSVYPRRIIDNRTDYTNAYTDRESSLRSHEELPEDLEKMRLINTLTQRNEGLSSFLSQHSLLTTIR